MIETRNREGEGATLDLELRGRNVAQGTRESTRRATDSYSQTFQDGPGAFRISETLEH